MESFNKSLDGHMTRWGMDLSASLDQEISSSQDPFPSAGESSCDGSLAIDYIEPKA